MINWFRISKRGNIAPKSRRCGLRDDIFPDVAECGAPIAQVSARGARESGLAQGTPLVIGGGDCQLGSIGVGVVNDAAVFGGSFWQYEYNTGTGKTSPKCDVRVNCHDLPARPEVVPYRREKVCSPIIANLRSDLGSYAVEMLGDSKFAVL